MADQPQVPSSKARWSWRRYPASRVDGARMVLPLGCMYTPLGEAAVELPYEPLKCSNCGGFLNLHCPVDHRSKSWQCPFCLTTSAFPPHYANMTEHHLPAELMKQYPTVEFVRPAQRAAATMVLVVDTCVDTEAEVEHLKGAVLKALSRLPENVNVALITFGATVQLHDLSGQTEFSRTIVFRGSTEVTPAMIKQLVKQPHRYACPVSQAEFVVTTAIEELTVDCWPTRKDHRPLRCVGAAVSTAASLLDVVAPKVGSSVLAFISGACTEGPGAVVECPREVMMRMHPEVRDGKAPMWDAATSFYDTLMQRMVASGHALHIMMASLDQIGLAEMRPCVQATGGVVMVADTWKRTNLKASLDIFLAKRPDGDLAFATDVTFDVNTSPTWKVMGVVGPCIGTGKRSSSVSDSEMGLGGTCQWTTSYLDQRSTLAVYFETAQPPAGQPKSTHRCVQFVTRYQLGATDRIRVTTLQHEAVEQVNFSEMSNDFDQETAAVLLARVAVHKTETTPLFDVLRWLDRQVIRLVSRFGEYVKDQPHSLKLSSRLAHFPLFMFHLRRSAYFHVFGNSPDETAVLRLTFLRATSEDSIVMIHPTLYSYTMGQATVPVSLDVTSVTPDNVLLFDTFFEVLVHHGETIREWRKAGYESNPEFAHFTQFLEVPRADAQALAANRFPVPRLIECAKGEPDARILMNRINPSRTHNNAGQGQGQYGAEQGELVYTDDASLQTFMDHLKKLAVQST